MRLTTDRIELRDYTLNDAVAMAAYQAHPAYQRFYPASDTSRPSAEELVKLFIGWSEQSPRENYQLAMVESGTNTLIGSCGIRSAGFPPGIAELGIKLDPAYWGRGLACDAGRLLINFAFHTLPLVELHGTFIAANERVEKLVRKLGFLKSTGHPVSTGSEPDGLEYSNWVLTCDVWRREVRL